MCMDDRVYQSGLPWSCAEMERETKFKALSFDIFSTFNQPVIFMYLSVFITYL